MSPKTDRWIRQQALANKIISPFAEGEKRPNVVSYGLSSMGYDFRLDDKFFIPHSSALVSPKDVPLDHYREVRSQDFILHPGTTILAQTVEYFQMPDNVVGFVYGKSSYARLGVKLNMTPIEPGWCGYITLSITNDGSDFVRLFAYEGIGQIVFHEAEEVPMVTYAMKQGKYQNAQGIMTAKVD